MTNIEQSAGKYLSGDQLARGVIDRKVCGDSLLKVTQWVFIDPEFSKSTEAHYVRMAFTDVLVGHATDLSELDGLQPGDEIDFEIHRSADQYEKTLLRDCSRRNALGLMTIKPRR